MEQIRRAVIMAAGEGSRLRPVTLKTPKPLIRVNGKRIIDTSIEALRNIGVEDIYIVVGYQKEQYYNIYGKVPDIHLIENPFYQQGNNITSLYAARQYLQNAYIVEGDIFVFDGSVFAGTIKKSAYMATWMENVPEWTLMVKNDRITFCTKEGGESAYRLWGISAWNSRDGALLAEQIRCEFEEKKNWGIYWDEIPLLQNPEQYDLGIIPVGEKALCEIDTLRELVQIDKSYDIFLKGDQS